MAAGGAEAGTGLRSMAMSTGPNLGEPSIKQTSFDWSARDTHMVLINFQMEINEIFITYGTNNAETVPISKKWLGRDGLHPIQTLDKAEQKTRNTVN